MKELSDACRLGEAEAKKVIETLSPHMAKKLKDQKKWEKPSIAIECASSIELVKASKLEIAVHSALPHDDIIFSLLGPLCLPSEENPSEVPETGSAYANLLTDVSFESDELVSAKDITSVLKGLQPYREKPSKDRSKRFAAGEIPFNAAIPDEHDLAIYSYWCIKPLSSSLQAAKNFLLSQVLYISQDDKPVNSSISKCPNTSVVLNVCTYDPGRQIFTIAGRSALMKANKTLLFEVTGSVVIDNDNPDQLKFDHTVISFLRPCKVNYMFLHISPSKK